MRTACISCDEVDDLIYGLWGRGFGIYLFRAGLGSRHCSVSSLSAFHCRFLLALKSDFPISVSNGFRVYRREGGGGSEGVPLIILLGSLVAFRVCMVVVLGNDGGRDRFGNPVSHWSSNGKEEDQVAHTKSWRKPLNNGCWSHVGNLFFLLTLSL